jgi:hypothetical protein
MAMMRKAQQSTEKTPELVKLYESISSVELYFLNVISGMEHGH